MQLATFHPSATPVWPPTGIALAALILFGRRFWPAIFLGAFLANLTTAGTVATSLGIATGNTLEAVIGAYLVNLFANGRYAFDRARHIFTFAAIALFATMVSATIGVGSLALGGLASSPDLGQIWLTWWLGDLAGALLVAPFLILWVTKPAPRWNIQEALDAWILLLATILVGAIVFGGLFPFPYLSVPLLVWVAFRFTAREAITVVVLLATIAIWGTLRSLGPFVEETPNESLLLLQAFMAIMTLVTLPLAAVVSERTGVSTELTQSERRFRSLVENSFDVIALIGPTGIVNYVSPSGQKVFGYHESEVVGKSGFSFIHPDDRLRTMKKLAEIVLHPGKSVTAEFRIRHKNGSWRWTEAVGNNLLFEPSIQSVVVNYRDITERKEIEQAKSDFVSLVSHQLRTPLTAISWYTSMLLDKKYGGAKTQEKYLAEIYQANRRMIELVNALLNVSRIELGTFAVQPEPTDIVALGKSTLKDFEGEIRSKKLNLEESYAPNLPKVSVDPKLMRIVFQNLFSNAVKYTPPLQRIKISIAPQGKNITISVADTGYGIPQKDQAKIFTKLFRAENAKVHDTQGSGLGLYVTKAIVHHSGGQIRFISEENKGTTFTVTLPLAGMPKKAGTTKLQEFETGRPSRDGI